MRRTLFQLSWKVLNTLLLTGLFWLCYHWTSAYGRPIASVPAVLSAVALYVSAFVLLGWLIYCLCPLFRARWFKTLGFAVLFIWGATAYFCWPVDRGDKQPNVDATLVTEAPTRLLSCFLSGSLLESVPEDGSQFHYELFHLILILYMGGWAFALWGRSSLNNLRRRGILDRHLHVFWGVTEQGAVLARDIIRRSAILQVEFNIPLAKFDAEEAEEDVRKIEKIDCVWLGVDYGRISRSNLKGCVHYFLSDSGRENVRLANELVKLLPSSPRGEKKTFHVRIEPSADEQSFYDWADAVKDKVDVVIVRESEMVSRQLMTNYPILTQCPGVSFNSETALTNGGVRLLLIGFGATGWDVLERLVTESRFSVAGGRELPFEAVVLDKSESVEREFAEYCPEAVAAYHVSFVKMDVFSPEFLSWITTNMGRFNRIVLALGGDDANISALCRIERRLVEKGIVRTGEWLAEAEKPRVFVTVKSPERSETFGTVLASKSSDPFYSRVRLIGNLDEIYLKAFFNFDDLYEIASVLHGYHATGRWMSRREDRVELDALWSSANFSDRNSSLSSASGERNSVRLLGYALSSDAKRGKFSVRESCALRLEDPQTLDVLARNEHYRWNAWHRMQGYRVWDMNTPPIEDEREKKANKLKVFRRHAAIVDYDCLPEVDMRILAARDPLTASCLSRMDFVDDGSAALPDGYTCMQKWDREFCRQIVINLEKAGYGFYVEKKPISV